MVAVVQTQAPAPLGVARAQFPRAARLLSPNDFARALKTRPSRGAFLWIHRLDADNVESADIVRTAAAEVSSSVATNRRNPPPNALAKSASRPQLGLMIAKRNAKTAVLRNAIKRRIREQFRLRAARLPARSYVVRLSKSATKADVPSIVGEWVNSLEFDIRKNRPNRPIELGVK
jgi:ribonuclease P protein component